MFNNFDIQMAGYKIAQLLCAPGVISVRFLYFRNLDASAFFSSVVTSLIICIYKLSLAKFWFLRDAKISLSKSVPIEMFSN